MHASMECPRCRRQIWLTVRGFLSPRAQESRVEVEPTELARRQHAGCFGGGDGGVPVPTVTLMPTARGFGRAAS